jgi:hypothetical protein
MLNLLIRLIVLVSLAHLGLELTQTGDCKSRECSLRLEKASREVLRVNWRPISVFPEEGRRFR